MNAERLRMIKSESECAEHAEIEYRVIRLQDFDWLTEQAKKVEDMEQKLNAVSTFAHNETARYRDALEKIEMMSNGFAKSLAQEVLNDGMDES